MSLIQESLEYLHKSRQNSKRIRTIYLHFRDLEKFDAIADIPLLNLVVEGLRKLKLPYSRNEIYSVFKLTSKEDYEKGDRRSVLENLLRKANEKSVF